MKNELEQKEKFIELRAQCYSFDSIAQAIGVSKPTLLKWHCALENEINSMKFMILDSLIEKYKLAKVHRIESYKIMLDKIKESFDQCKLDNMPADKLLDMHLKLLDRLKAEMDIEYKEKGAMSQMFDNSDLQDHTVKLD